MGICVLELSGGDTRQGEVFCHYDAKVHEEKKRKLKKTKKVLFEIFKKIKALKNLLGLMRREEIFFACAKGFFATKVRRLEGARRNCPLGTPAKGKQ